MLHVFLWDQKTLTLGCIPFKGLDGCHLKNNYGGILLIADGRDANDQYLHVAFGVIKNETKDYQSWFINLIFEDIGDSRRCFISDQQKVCTMILMSL